MPAEKSILDAIRFARLVGGDEPTDLNWRQMAELLADELASLAMRLSGSPGATDADEERVARAALALKQFRAACAETDDL
jgi:hypothetical protein